MVESVGLKKIPFQLPRGLRWGWPVLWREMEVKTDETEKRLMVGER